MDAQEVLKEKCGETKKCSSLKDTLDACNERVSNKPTTAEICTQEVVDFMHCVDHCVSFYKFFLAKSVAKLILSLSLQVAKSLFKHLK